eukprot:Rhum_TRINITY_DN14848_c10_g2::Rhum_TRINITY_DN14848_c10_g2_i1::g.122713::m.122713
MSSSPTSPVSWTRASDPADEKDAGDKSAVASPTSPAPAAVMMTWSRPAVKVEPRAATPPPAAVEDAAAPAAAAVAPQDAGDSDAEDGGKDGSDKDEEDDECSADTIEREEQSIDEEEGGDDPWEAQHDQSEWKGHRVRKAQPVVRESAHYVIEGTPAEGAVVKKGGLKSYFILSCLGTRKDAQLITVCTTTGELRFKGIAGVDVFKTEGDARAHLTDKLGLRILNAAKGSALIGSFLSGAQTHIGVVTAAEARLTLPSGEPVYTLTDVKWVKINLAYPCNTDYAQKFSGLVSDFQLNNLHYYTFPFVDITRPWPSHADTPDPHFIWNSFLTKPFERIGLGAWAVKLLQGVAVGSSNVPLGIHQHPPHLKKRLKRFYRKYNPEKMSEIKNVMGRYPEAELFDKLTKKYGPEPESELADEYDSDEGKPTEANVAMLTRRWCRHPGTRYNARGIDATGAPANELECELLFSAADKWGSFVWRRGSVPIKWSSVLASTVKMGQARFVIRERPYEHSSKYFDALARRYAGWGGDNAAPTVTCFSLLHTEPEHGELLLVEHYQQALREVRKRRPTTRVELLGFDWHRTVRQLGLDTAVDGAWKLFAGPLGNHGVTTGTVEVSQACIENKSLLATVPAPTADERLKKKQTEKKGVFANLRGLVSQQKLRFTNDGFNLDLTYITPRIIAMGFPSAGAESYYRNPADEVERFFETRHAGHYRIYNLCTERDYDDEGRFGGQYRRWPFEDHNAPAPITMICDLVDDALAFLAAHPKNVIAAHCKAGKGRTGVMISALLMTGCAPEAVPPRNAAAALGYFGAARTKDGHGVTIPSQRRYIYYYEDMLLKHGGLVPKVRPLRITKVVLQSPVKSGTPPAVYVLVNEAPKWVMTKPGKQYFDRGPLVTKWDSRKVEPPQQAGARFTLFDLQGGKEKGGGVVVRGDVKIVFMAARSFLGDEHLFHFGFHTSFIDSELIAKGEPVRFSKLELDKACKDEKHTTYRRDLQVEVYFSAVEGEDAVDAAADAAAPTSPASPVPGRSSGGADGEESDEEEEVEDGGVRTEIAARQTGVLRLNCVDSLDRTNLASFFMSLHVAAELRRKIRGDDGEAFEMLRDHTLDDVKASLGEPLVGHLAEMFVATGDACSLLYTNTQATHTNTIREMSSRLGKAQSNAMLSVKRRYHNTVSDSGRHNGFLAFLGQAKHPETPPRLVSVKPACVLSPFPHVKDKTADPSVLLHMPPAGGHPWVAPVSEAHNLVVFVPDLSLSVHAIGLCFRCDASGDDENFPTSFEVMCGDTLETMETALPLVSIPRTKDFTWLFYPLERPGKAGTRLFSVKFSNCIGSTVVLGGLRLLGPPSLHCHNAGDRTPADSALPAPFVAPSVPAVSHTVVSQCADSLILGMDIPTLLSSIVLNIPDSECEVSAGLTLGRLTPLSSVTRDGGVGPATFASPSGEAVPTRVVHIRAKGGAQTVSVVRLDSAGPLLAAYKPPPPPSSGLSLPKKQLSRKRAKKLGEGRDDEMLATFVLVAGESTIVGIRLVTTDPAVQARAIQVGIAVDHAVQTVPSQQAKSAIVNHAEDVCIPACEEGSELEFHFEKPVKGNLVRIQVSPLTQASKYLSAAPGSLYALVEE